ncbi:MAG: cardiolipin synthase [Thermoanaerobaculia bacterium]|nr:cardiolipin synthase [Thermoanaerobaculia bacterium]
MVTTVLFVAHFLGALTSISALMSTRTSQGSIAWIMALNTLPLLSVPAYWVFGRDKFRGYVTAREQVKQQFGIETETVRASLRDLSVQLDDDGSAALVGQNLAEMLYLRSNQVDLLIDGVATFDSILAGIDLAQDYILMQFYIVRDDEIGAAVAERLIGKAREGVRIWFLYDEIGCSDLGDSYLERLEAEGIKVSAFHSTKGLGNRFQINFRNHRKIVVVDGKVGWVGGANIGDEYLGRDPAFPNWRDTHVRIAGPAALQLQLSFGEDWRWATGDIIDVPWKVPQPEDLTGNAIVLILPTGPADRLESASLMYQQAIHTARERIWISSPYFVPDQAVIASLHLAALRGVDVRILIPEVGDSKLVYYSAWAFAGDLLQSGISIYRYQPGFIHQKVFLVDDTFAGVGTANFDNRSFRLNFEVTALIHQVEFATSVERMFEADFERSRPMTLEDVEGKSLLFNLAARAAYLTAPVQ